ncbi:aspartate aminotransferase family protein [Roseivirga sp. BDSF3-8]|uniref:pyridoxal phosphate-dependent decarboxylase family protein n=1 Tax=Roseivirga sp. BDSF3-8 TaxID=3241598 RepID=UPI003531D815
MIVAAIKPTIHKAPEGVPYRHLFAPSNMMGYRQGILQAVDAVISQMNKTERPFTGASLAEVGEKFDRHGPADFEQGVSMDECLEEVQRLYMDDCIYFHDEGYVAHLNCPVVMPALVAEVISSAINTSMDTWDQSIGATLMEQKLVRWTLDGIGFPEDGEGIFTSGGTQSNLMGMLLARDHYISSRYGDSAKIGGLPVDSSRFRIFCSEMSHFSIQKAASLLGLGQHAVVQVAADDCYRMDMTALREAIEMQRAIGNIPIAVVGTAGTTDFGSIDPLRSIAQMAREYGLWFHVDAAYGGGLMLSDLHKEKLTGIEEADSATIDYHKTFFLPVCASGFFMRDRQHVRHISYHADYLNPKEQERAGVPNMVSKSLQTTRRFDALKLWMTLRTMGRSELGRYIDRIVELAQETAGLLREARDFEVLHRPEISAIVFRYCPVGEGDKQEVNLNELNAGIRKRMFASGRSLIAGTKVYGETYLKFTLLNPQTPVSVMEEIIGMIRAHGEALVREQEQAMACA